MSSPDQSGVINGAPLVPARRIVELEGSCRTAGCPEQHRHPIFGWPPDYHWRRNDGTYLPRWEMGLKSLRRGSDPLQWWYRIEEVARTMGVSWQTVRRWIRGGKLRAFRYERGRVFFIRGGDLDEFLRTSNRAYPKEDP